MKAKKKTKTKNSAKVKKKRKVQIIGNASLIHGDAFNELDFLPKKHFSLIISSPPYNIGKIYERTSKKLRKRKTLEQYIEWHKQSAAKLVDTLRDDGNLCWQVGNYIKDGEVFPLDIVFYKIFSDLGLQLRNRIIWKFNFGLNADRRFSGRYETLLWFSKSQKYTFNLDAVRIPQLYPGKRHASTKEKNAGKLSGNPLGKNPSDYWEFFAEKDFLENPIWDIPNVKANHPEKTVHPCQFPIELAERCVLALTKEGDAILDPYVGTGASVIAAVKNKRKAVGIDKNGNFLRLAAGRLRDLKTGKLAIRPMGKPIKRPSPTEKVAQTPDEWLAKKKKPLRKKKISKRVVTKTKSLGEKRK